jgi:hypothetical protein
LKYRLRLHLGIGEELNRRVKVEQYLFDCAAGKKPLPDQATCRELALYLGTPKRKLEV